MALIYPQNGDLTKLLKSARKKVPQSARLSAGGGAKAKRAMPKCLRHEFEDGFPNNYMIFLPSYMIFNFLRVKQTILIIHPPTEKQLDAAEYWSPMCLISLGIFQSKDEHISIKRNLKFASRVLF